MTFCRSCGTELPQNSTFCHNCGAVVAPDGSQPAQDSMPPANQYAQYPVKKKIPGRGFGITSLVLGIIGVFYGLSSILSAVLLNNTSGIINDIIDETAKNAHSSYLAGEKYKELVNASIDASMLFTCIMIMIICLLGLIFSICAIKRKYKNGISVAGCVLSSLGLPASIVAILITVL